MPSVEERTADPLIGANLLVRVAHVPGEGSGSTVVVQCFGGSAGSTIGHVNPALPSRA
jgi:hypothetical protein